MKQSAQPSAALIGDDCTSCESGQLLSSLSHADFVTWKVADSLVEWLQRMLH